jgi:eukaryotic-like serine/threonine-protein kinase
MQEAVRMNTPVETLQAASSPFQLPPKLLNQASRRLCWLSLLVAVTTVLIFLVQRLIQPEAAALHADPLNGLTVLALVLGAAGLMSLHHYRLVSPGTLLLFGMAFEVLVAFCIAFPETSMPFHPDEPVRGASKVALWIVIVGILVPNRPGLTLLTALAAASMWPLAYAINVTRLDLVPLPANRLAAWMFINYLAAAWAYFIGRRMHGMEIAAQKALDLGSYQLEALIGRGGMGEVWRARHKMLARDAAIKIVRPDLVNGRATRQSDIAIRRFEREARVTASLQSPHTVFLYDFGTSRDGSFYFVMELLDGISLQKLVQTFGPQPPSRVIHLLRQVCLSLEEAHHRGLVHRDLKPSNVMVCQVALDYDVAKVLDFGLVKPVTLGDVTNLTLDGVSAGTPGYIAPEIAMGEIRIDARADIYTLGCVAYYLLTGTLVFNEVSPTAMAVAHVQKTPDPPSTRTELPVPADLERVVLACLAKQPGDRPASARALIQALDACRDAGEWTSADAEAWWQMHLPPSSSYRRATIDAPAAPSPVVAR